MNIPPIRTAPGTPDPGYLPNDDLRHFGQYGERMRDSLFWQCMMPEERLGFQVYLYMTSDGLIGSNVVVIGEGDEPLVLDFKRGQIGPEADYEDLRFEGMHLVQPANSGRATFTYESDKVRMAYDFTAIHDPFSYHQNPDGMPQWFALNRLEQTGWVKGFIEFGGRRVEFDRIGHRDHSWGMRQWGVPQHWKWLVAYTPDASRVVNAWVWIARGEWGVGGYVVRDGELVPIRSVTQKATYDDRMGQKTLRLDMTDTRGDTCLLTMERYGIARLPTPGRNGTMIMEAACDATIDGKAAAGQFETQWSLHYLEHLIELNRR